MNKERDNDKEKDMRKQRHRGGQERPGGGGNSVNGERKRCLVKSGCSDMVNTTGS